MIVILALAAITTVIELLIWREAKAQKRRHDHLWRRP